MATVFVPSYELGSDGTYPAQIQAKIAAAIRTLSASIRNNTGAAGVTVPANQITMPGLVKG